ncbi:MAG: sugar/nucleoside kinase (ribokinase family) [Saprospiraceae bacterium]|jgi:sugar/nucleoside kinase (ribokinase family)
MSLLVVGTVAFDTIETAYGKVERVIGGAAQYAGYAASYFTNDINLVSIVGDDFPQGELDEMSTRGMKLDGLKVVEGGKSFFWAGKYHDDMNGRDTLVTDLNVLADFDPVLPDSYKNSEYILLGNLTPDIQISVIEQLETKPKLIVLDTMNFWIDIALDKLMKAISLCDVLTINDEEARMLSGEFSLVKAAAKILDMGPSILIIKKGEHGALLFDRNNVFFGPALPLEKVVDPTGAGDCFAGGFLGHIAKTGDMSFENMKRALIYGATMASFAVEDFSNHRIKAVTQEEIDQRVKRFVKLSSFSM